MHADPIDPTSTWMYREAAEAADVVAVQFARNQGAIAVLAAQLRAAPPPFVVTCARGSSDHAASYARYLNQTSLGIVTASLSPSIASVYQAPLQLRGALFIAISQSGRSPDLLHNARAARAAGAHVLALVNVEDSPLAGLADTVVPLGAGPERSVAATKSCLASLAAIAQLVAHWSGDGALLEALDTLSQALAEAWRQDWSPLVDGLVDAHNLFVLGRGPGLAAAQEAALKFKETCGLHAEAYSSAEVQHGPMALVGPGFPVLALAQPDRSGAGTVEVAAQFAWRGAAVWVATSPGLASAVHPAVHLPQVAVADPALAPMVTLQSFYRAINALALRRGRNPDLPPHLHKITETT